MPVRAGDIKGKPKQDRSCPPAASSPGDYLQVTKMPLNHKFSPVFCSRSTGHSEGHPYCGVLSEEVAFSLKPEGGREPGPWGDPSVRACARGGLMSRSPCGSGRDSAPLGVCYKINHSHLLRVKIASPSAYVSGCSATWGFFSLFFFLNLLVH